MRMQPKVGRVLSVHMLHGCSLSDDWFAGERPVEGRLRAVVPRPELLRICSTAHQTCAGSHLTITTRHHTHHARAHAAAHHAARLKAEAEAQDAAQRLAVAQQQIAEYAAAKAADAEALVQHSQTLDGLLSQVVAALRGSGADGGASGSGAEPSSNGVAGGEQAAGSHSATTIGPPDMGAAALAALATLQERLQETAGEASAFAALQNPGTDSERAKRSSAQVGGVGIHAVLFCVDVP